MIGAAQIALGAFLDEVRDRLRCCGATPELDAAEDGLMRRRFGLDRDPAAAVSAILRLRCAPRDGRPLTFREYIASRRVMRRSPVDDFVRDAKQALTADGVVGPPLPDATRWRELREYLRNSGAAPAAISAGAAVWGDFVAERGRWKPRVRNACAKSLILTATPAGSATLRGPPRSDARPNSGLTRLGQQWRTISAHGARDIPRAPSGSAAAVTADDLGIEPKLPVIAEMRFPVHIGPPGQALSTSAWRPQAAQSSSPQAPSATDRPPARCGPPVRLEIAMAFTAASSPNTSVSSPTT
jgi:hypothetical protein